MQDKLSLTLERLVFIEHLKLLVLVDFFYQATTKTKRTKGKMEKKTKSFWGV